MHPSPLLIFHGTAGAVALLAGTAAVVARKGGRPHGWTGNVFTASMLALAASGVILAAFRSQIGNVFGGLITLYVVSTAWTAVRSKNGRSGLFDWVAMFFGLATGCAVLWYGALVAAGRFDHAVPAGMDFFLGVVVLLGVAGDARMIFGGGVTGRGRIIRHLWRMCFALFEASGSFFMGRQALFPEAIQRSGLLIALTLLPLVLLVFWAIRVRVTGGWQPVLRLRSASSRLPAGTLP